MNLTDEKLRQRWKLLINFNAEKTQLVLFDWFDNSPIDEEMDGSVLEESY